MGVCDEWGGAESRGNGARPVEWMIMNDTCATHRSRVPRRSFGRNKRRSDDIGRRERTRPGFYFMFCVWQSSVRGCRFSVMFVYFVIKMWLSVRRFPPPSSHIYELRYSINVPYIKNAAVKWFHMRCACSMGCPIYELTINFLYLLEMVSLHPSKSNNVPFMENAAVKWFHMRCACSMGCPI